jgi:hypothetical protein
MLTKTLGATTVSDHTQFSEKKSFFRAKQQQKDF